MCVLRHLASVVFVCAVLGYQQTAYAFDCPNPKLGWTVTVTGPTSECVEAVEDDIDESGPAGCPAACAACNRDWDEEYELQYEGCRVVPGDPTKSESGEITCKCVVIP